MSEAVQFDVDHWRNTPEEEAELRALQSWTPPARQLTPDAQWRRDYAEDQRRKRIVGVQHDLFGAKPITHHRRNPGKAQAIDPRWRESVAAIVERARLDPSAAYGVEREDRPTYLTAEQKTAIVASAANWLRIGQRIRIVDAPGAVDPAYGPGKLIGREGVVFRLCSAVFAERVYVFLDPLGAERVEKIEFVELRDLEPIGE